MYQVKDFQIEMLEPGRTEAAIVSHITDPDNFYIQLDSSTERLDKILTYLDALYKTGKQPPEDHVWHLGDPCAALYEGVYRRGRVTGTPHNKQHVEVTFVDFGYKDYLLKKSIFPLPSEMLNTPLLSHHCCLAGVSCSDDFWTPEKIAKFEDFVMEQELIIHIVSYDECQDVYHLLVFDENDALINRKFAEASRCEFIENNSLYNGLDQKLAAAKGAHTKPPRGLAKALLVDKKVPGDLVSPNQLFSLEMTVGEKANVSIAYVSSPSEWWCNLTKYAGACDHLTEQMGAVYSRMGPKDGVLHNLRPGILCAAFVDSDNIWYRASIEKVTGPSVLVTFLDYGNMDMVAVGNIKELKEEFQDLPSQAVWCCLDGVVPASGAWSDRASDMFEKLVMYKDYTATVMEQDVEGRLHMKLIDCADNSNVSTAFLKMCPEATKGTPQSTPVVEMDMTKYPSLNIQKQSKAEVFLSWVKTPGEFYVQLADNQKVLDVLADDLQKFYCSSKGEPAANVKVGSPVAAKFSEDEDWYRAVVKSMSETSAEVEFVDYGNSDQVPIDSLQKLAKQFSAIPAQAVRCSLAGIRPLTQGSTWSGDAKEFLETLTEKGAICKFLNCKGNEYEVDLEAQGKNIAKEMIGLAVVRGSTPDGSASVPKFPKYQFVEPAMGQSYQVYVSSVESVESFHVQLVDQMNDLEQLMGELQEFYKAGKGVPISTFTVGLPCAAQYDDEQWYRAEVRSFTLRDVDVFFVDYGNTQSAPKTSVFQLDSAFITRVKAQAVHCQLSVAESRNMDAQLEKFHAFVDEEILTLTVEGKEGSKFLVDLSKGGMSVTEELKGSQTTKAIVEKSVSGYTPGKVSPGQTVSAFASFIDSPARFWVQLAGCDDELTSMMETLSEHYAPGAEPPLNNPSPGQPCVALYDDDKQWYRASVLSIHGTEIRVQFVDYGNTELVDRQNIKSISGGFMSSPLLAVECCLDGFQSCSVSDDAVELMESLMSEQELSVTFKGPKTVSVQVGNVDVAQALLEKGLGPRLQRSAPQVKTPPSRTSGQTSPQTLDSGFSSSPEMNSVKYKEAVPPSGSAEAIITHVDETSGMIYVQLLSSESQLEQLSSKIQSLYSSGGSPLKGPPTKGMVCCAKFCVDQCWYRAQVEQVLGAKVQVQFVDYGNSDTVNANSLKSVSAELMGFPKQAFLCKLKGLKSWTAQTYKALSFLDEKLNVRFVTSSSPFEIQASVNGQDLLQMLLKSPTPSPPQKKFDSRSNSSDSRDSKVLAHSASRSDSSSKNGFDRFESSRQYKSPVSEQTAEQVFQSQKMPAEEQAVYVSHVSDDGTFYVQLSKDVNTIDQMTSKVENCSSTRHPSPRAGAACGAQYSVDGQWYRGLIESVSGSSVQVVFVDYGNTETCEMSSLKPLPAHLLVPPLAYHCQVGGIQLTAEQVEAFRSASEETEYLVTFREGIPYDVIVKDEKGTSLADTIFKPTTVPQPRAPSQTVLAVVSYVGDEGDFYLQLSKDLDRIVDFRDKIQTACEENTEKLDTYDEGQVCLAQFSEDGAWYRASVLNSSQDDVTVVFVDYGNTDSVDKGSLLVIPPALMSVPACAYECKIPGVKSWKKGQKQKFEAMTEGKTMNAHFLSSKPPYEVELTLNIGLELEEDESTEDVTEKESSADVSVQKVEPEQNENGTEESTEEFEVAKEEEESAAELAENSGATIEHTQKPADEKVSSDSGLEHEAGEVSTVATQEHTETVVSEEEFSDAKESPEDSASVPDGMDQHELETEALMFPAQTPPALDACIVSHLNPDGTFYLQLVSEDESREKMSDKLQNECESASSKTVVCPLVNFPCCARFSEDDAWYRATIEKVEDNIVEVLFVDFGNTDRIPVEDLRELSAESLQVPPLAYKCVLEDCDMELVRNKLEEATIDQTLTVTFSTTGTIPYAVNLQLENGTNISTMLIKPAEQTSTFQSTASEEAEAVQGRIDVCPEDRKCVALEQSQGISVTVSHVVSPSLFYVQHDNLAHLDEMSDAMLEHYSSLAEEDGVIDHLRENQLCASQFGEDGSWYRALVRNIDFEADTCSLFFVDYGNSDCVPKSSVRELPAEFESLPWQCVSCSLAGVGCQGDWSDEVNAAFEDMVANKSFVADVLNGDGLDEPYTLRISDSGCSVAESLLALNLPGVESAEIPSLQSLKQTATVHDEKLSLDNADTEATEGGLADKEVIENESMEDFDETEQDFSRHLRECTAQETVDDLDESEQEFSRQLQACTARMESTMVEDMHSARLNANSTALEEPLAVSNQEEQGKEEEEDDDFEDAVEAEQDSAEEDVNGSDDVQIAVSCVSDGLAELEWLDIHVCVAVSSSEFWCQLPSARSILSGTTLGIEKARISKVVKDVKIGNLYLVCDPPQTNYRGKVLSDCDDSGRVLVLKLDYGTEERVSTKCLYPLAKHQVELPAQAFCCCLGDRDEVSASEEWLNNLITQGEAVDSDLQVKIVGRKANGTMLVDVREKPASLKTPCEGTAGEASEGDVKSQNKQVLGAEVSMETLEISHPVMQSTILGDTLSQSCIEKSDGERDYIVHTLEDDKDYEVTVAPGGRPDSFYVVKASCRGLLDALADDIEEEVKEQPERSAEGESLAVSSPCLVLEADSTKWFRGQVKSTGDIWKVLCVDRGMVLEVGRDGVRDLPSRLLDAPVQAVLCCLADLKPVDDQWCDGAISFFTDAVISGPLKLTVCGTCDGDGAYKVTLYDESKSCNLTNHLVGVESSINRTLVELGYAEAVAGSPLDVALQMERTINDPDRLEEMETSFTEHSLLRENSLGYDSDVEGNTEQDREAMKASGDAPSMATESDEESEWPETPPFAARQLDALLDGGNGGDAGESTPVYDDHSTDNSSMMPVYIAPDQDQESRMEEGICGLGAFPAAIFCKPKGEGLEQEDEKAGSVVVTDSGSESGETVEEYLSAEGLPDLGEVLTVDSGDMYREREDTQVSDVNNVYVGANDVDCNLENSSHGIGIGPVPGGDKMGNVAIDPACTDSLNYPMQAGDISNYPTASSVTGSNHCAVDGKDAYEPKEEGANFLDLNWGKVEIVEGSQTFVDEENNIRTVIIDQTKEEMVAQELSGDRDEEDGIALRPGALVMKEQHEENGRLSVGSNTKTAEGATIENAMMVTEDQVMEVTLDTVFAELEILPPNTGQQTEKMVERDGDKIAVLEYGIIDPDGAEEDQDPCLLLVAEANGTADAYPHTPPAGSGENLVEQDGDVSPQPEETDCSSDSPVDKTSAINQLSLSTSPEHARIDFSRMSDTRQLLLKGPTPETNERAVGNKVDLGALTDSVIIDITPDNVLSPQHMVQLQPATSEEVDKAWRLDKAQEEVVEFSDQIRQSDVTQACVLSEAMNGQFLNRDIGLTGPQIEQNTVTKRDLITDEYENNSAALGNIHKEEEDTNEVNKADQDGDAVGEMSEGEKDGAMVKTDEEKKIPCAVEEAKEDKGVLSDERVKTGKRQDQVKKVDKGDQREEKKSAGTEGRGGKKTSEVFPDPSELGGDREKRMVFETMEPQTVSFLDLTGCKNLPGETSDLSLDWEVSPMECPLPSSSFSVSSESSREERMDASLNLNEHNGMTMSSVAAHAACGELHPVSLGGLAPAHDKDEVCLLPYEQPQSTEPDLNGSIFQNQVTLEVDKVATSSGTSDEASDTVLTSDDLEEVAVHMETMVAQETQEQLKEEIEEHQEELASMIEEYGNTIDLERDDIFESAQHVEDGQAKSHDPSSLSLSERLDASRSLKEKPGISGSIAERSEVRNHTAERLEVRDFTEESDEDGDLTTEIPEVVRTADRTGVRDFTEERPESSDFTAEKHEVGDLKAESCDITAQRPEISDITAERIEAGDCFEERPEVVSRRAERPKRDDSVDGRCEGCDSTAERPEVGDFVMDRPEVYDSSTERPQVWESKVERPEIGNSTAERPVVDISAANRPEIGDIAVEKPEVGDSTLERSEVDDYIAGKLEVGDSIVERPEMCYFIAEKSVVGDFAAERPEANDPVRENIEVGGFTTERTKVADLAKVTTDVGDDITETTKARYSSEDSTEGYGFTANTAKDRDFTAKTLEIIDFSTETAEVGGIITETTEIGNFTIDKTEIGYIVTETAEISDFAADKTGVGDYASETTDVSEVTTEITEISYFSLDKTEIGDFTEEATEVGDTAVETTEISNSTEEATEVTDTAVETTEIGNSTEEKTEVTDTAVETTEISNSAEEKTEVSDTAVETTEISNSTEEKTEVTDTAVEATEISNSTEEKTEVTDTAVETTEISNSTEEKTEVTDTAVETTEISNSTEEATEVSDTAVETTEISNSTEEKTEVSDTAVETTETSNSAEEATEVADTAVETTEISNSTEEATEVSDTAVETAEISNSAEEATEVTDTAVETTETSNSAEEATEVTDTAVETTETSNSTEEATEVSDTAVETTEISNSAEEGTEVTDTAVETTEIGNSTEEGTEVSDTAVETTETSNSAEEATEVTDTAAETTEISNSTEEATEVSDTAVETTETSNSAEEATEVTDTAVETAEISDSTEEKTEVDDSTSETTHSNLPTAETTQANFPTAEMIQANFPTAEMTPANFPTAEMIQANFPTAEMTPANFPTAEMTRANFPTAEMTQANFPTAEMIQANFPTAEMTPANFPTAEMTQANLPTAEMTRASLPTAGTTQASFPTAEMTQAYLPTAEATRANLSTTETAQANLPSAEMTQANLSTAETAQANLHTAETTQANLPTVETSQANLPTAETTQANLSTTETTQANLPTADTAQTNLPIAATTRANLSTGETTQANLPCAETTLANLPTVETFEACLPTAETSQANLPTAETMQANLPTAETTQANLPTAETTQASLPTAGTIQANLSSAETTRANRPTAATTRANLSTGETTQANLPTAETTQANLSTGETTQANLPTAENIQANLPTADRTQANLPTAETSQANLPTAETMQANLPTAETTQASLPTAETTQASLPTAETTQANLPTAETTQANLPTAETTQAYLPTAETIQAYLPTAETTQANLPSAETTLANLPTVETFEACLPTVETTQANLPTVETTQANLPTAETTQANLPTAETTQASLPTAETTQANLPTAETSQANLPTAERSQANLPTAETTQASLPTAETTQANLPTAETTQANLPTAETSQANLPTAERSQANLPTAETTQASLPTAETTQANLPTAETTQANLPTAETTQASLPTAETTQANLPTAETTQASLPTAETTQANLPPAETTQANLPTAETSQASLPTAETTQAHLPTAETSQANLPTAERSRANLPTAETTQASLPTAETTQANLHTAETTQANLPTAETTQASLPTAETTQANLPTAETTQANLSTAETSQANLPTAETSQANLPTAETAEASIANAETAQANLPSAETAQADLLSAETAQANLPTAETTQASITYAETAQANLSAESNQANLSSAETTQANLPTAETAEANLPTAETAEANLPSAESNQDSLPTAETAEANLPSAESNQDSLPTAGTTRTNHSMKQQLRPIIL